MFNRPQLKADARAAIRASQTSPYLVSAILYIILAVTGFLSYKIFFPPDLFEKLLAASSGNLDYFEMQYLIASLDRPFIARLIMAALSIVTNVISFGFVIFSLLTWRRLPNAIGNLFDGFSVFLRYIWLSILTGIFVYLWSLLFIIPGIIASYRYRLAFYLMIDHPDMSAMDCIRESKRLMQGHKGELFVLDLSFIGWNILAGIPFVGIYTLPYLQTTYAGYYDIRRSAEGQPWSGQLSGRDASGGMPPWEYK